MELAFLPLSELSTSLVPAVTSLLPAVTSSELLKSSVTKAADWLSTELYLVVVLEQNLREVKSTTHCRQNPTEVRHTGDAGALHVILHVPLLTRKKLNTGGIAQNYKRKQDRKSLKTPCIDWQAHCRKFWTRKDSPQAILDTKGAIRQF